MMNQEISTRSLNFCWKWNVKNVALVLIRQINNSWYVVRFEIWCCELKFKEGSKHEEKIVFSSIKLVELPWNKTELSRIETQFAKLCWIKPFFVYLISGSAILKTLMTASEIWRVSSTQSWKIHKLLIARWDKTKEQKINRKTTWTLYCVGLCDILRGCF